VPAAAVIPAPTAYTIIAAVETLVVDPRVWGCGAARLGRTNGACPAGPARAGLNPPQCMLPTPTAYMELTSSRRRPPSVEADAASPAARALGGESDNSPPGPRSRP